MIAMQTAFGNDDSFESAFALSLRNYAKTGDAVMVLSVSGLSPNLLAASRAAIDMGLTLFSIVGVRGKDLAAKSDFALIVDSDDYQVVENTQMSLIHWFVKAL
jgi:D-sedoheptulose 7-phosphate isomerase